MSFKKIFICFVAIMLTVFVPFSAAATQDKTPYSLTIECRIDANIPQNTEFKFEVTTANITFSENEQDESEQLTDSKKLDDFVINTATNTDGKLKYDFGSNLTDRKYFCFKLLSCSDNTVTIGNYLIEVRYYNADIVKTEVIKDGQHVEDLTFMNEPAFIPVNLSRVATVSFTTEGCEPITKPYDGKLDATINDKNYKLLSVTDGDDVKVTFDKAEYNSADVKKATKVKLSGLKLVGNDAAKYTLKKDSVELKASISPRPITVTADNITMTLGQNEPVLTYKLSEEIIEGNTVSGVLAHTAGSDVGEYTITLGTLSFGDNYTITFQEGKFIISSYTQNEIKDNATSISVLGYISPNSNITVSALDPQSEVYSSLATSTGWGKIISSFNISLSGGAQGQLILSFPVDQKYEGKEIAVYQYGDNGAITCYKSVVSGGKVSITTDELTQFMLVGEKDTESKDGGSVAWTILKVLLIILAVIVGLALVIILFFFLMIFFNKTEQLKSIIRTIKHLLGK